MLGFGMPCRLAISLKSSPFNSVFATHTHPFYNPLTLRVVIKCLDFSLSSDLSSSANPSVMDEF